MKKSTWIIIGILGALFITISAFSAGTIVGNLLLPQLGPAWFNQSTDAPHSEYTNGELDISSSGSAATDELFVPFWETWDIVHDQYIDQPVDDQEMMRGAITGMLESLGDQHTGYMNPDQFMQANIPMDGEYEGIGAWVDTSTEFLTIISPMPSRIGAVPV